MKHSEGLTIGSSRINLCPPTTNIRSWSGPITLVPNRHLSDCHATNPDERLFGLVKYSKPATQDERRISEVGRRSEGRTHKSCGVVGLSLGTCHQAGSPALILPVGPPCTTPTTSASHRYPRIPNTERNKNKKRRETKTKEKKRGREKKKQKKETLTHTDSAS